MIFFFIHDPVIITIYTITCITFDALSSRIVRDHQVLLNIMNNSIYHQALDILAQPISSHPSDVLMQQKAILAEQTLRVAKIIKDTSDLTDKNKSENNPFYCKSGHFLCQNDVLNPCPNTMQKDVLGDLVFLKETYKEYRVLKFIEDLSFQKTNK